MLQNKSWNIVLFFIIFTFTYFLSGQDIFQTFDTKFRIANYNSKLISILVFSDLAQIVWSGGIGAVLLGIYFAHKKKESSYKDLFWVFSTCFFCFSFRAILQLLAFYYNYLWIYGILSLIIGWFGMLAFYFILKWKNRLKNPRTTKETLEAIQKKKELIELIQKSIEHDKLAGHS